MSAVVISNRGAGWPRRKHSPGDRMPSPVRSDRVGPPLRLTAGRSIAVSLGHGGRHPPRVSGRMSGVRIGANAPRSISTLTRSTLRPAQRGDGHRGIPVTALVRARDVHHTAHQNSAKPAQAGSTTCQAEPRHLTDRRRASRCNRAALRASDSAKFPKPDRPCFRGASLRSGRNRMRHVRAPRRSMYSIES